MSSGGTAGRSSTATSESCRNERGSPGRSRSSSRSATPGGVAAASTANSSLGNSAVERCINEKVRRWVFPAPKGGGIVLVNYPFHFSSGGSGRAESDPAEEGEADEAGDSARPSGGFDIDQLAGSAVARTEARRVAGLTQFELSQRVTVPGGSSTMVAILNERVEAEQAFLFRPGGSGAGYANNPYRVVRFKEQHAVRARARSDFHLHRWQLRWRRDQRDDRLQQQHDRSVRRGAIHRNHVEGRGIGQ